MADPAPGPDEGRDRSDGAGMKIDCESTYTTPRWVKVFGIIFIIVLILLFLIQHLVFDGTGGHMP